MKKITFIAIILVWGCLTAHGQSFQNAIAGQFKIVPMTTGQNVLVFSGQNDTMSILQVIGIAMNISLNQQNIVSITLMPGQMFLFGPVEGWTWVPGETFTVIYPDGTRQSWLFNPYGGFPSFTSNTGGPCKFRNDRVGCKCYKYVPRGGRWGNVCICNHSLAAHDVR
jgi:hypothetical protein